MIMRANIVVASLPVETRFARPLDGRAHTPEHQGSTYAHYSRMSHAPVLALSPEDKLDILKQLDDFRVWHSLDDERRCSRCREVIDGQQILVFEQPGSTRRLRLQCPTPGCPPPTPSEWLYFDPVHIARFKNSSAA